MILRFVIYSYTSCDSSGAALTKTRFRALCTDLPLSGDGPTEHEALADAKRQMNAFSREGKKFIRNVFLDTETEYDPLTR